MRRSGVALVGWVIADQLEASPWLGRINTGVGGVGLARLHWIKKRVNANEQFGLRYEVYKPWRRYDALIFLKSMGVNARKLSQKYLDREKPVIFDANVNYYDSIGVSHYDGMLPTETQCRDAVSITEQASGVIADSKYISERCKSMNKVVRWIPDNVETSLTHPLLKSRLAGPIRLVWSGVPVKLFELLKIENQLRQYAKYYDLNLITTDLTSLSRWRKEYRVRFEKLLADINAHVTPYTDISSLFDIYSNSDVVLAPRFLDNSYNLGHTEWKITLAMACGCVALASPVPSYCDVQKVSHGDEVMLCSSEEEWSAAFDGLVNHGVGIDRRHRAYQIVDQHYSSRVIAEKHVDYIKEVMSRTGN